MQISTTLQQVDPLFINMVGRWHSMWQRCYLPNDQSYEYYGARGISVCQEWASFESFYAFWGNPPFEGATIGRANNDGNYEPSNCEWQTQEQQNNNTRRSKLIAFNGKTQSIRDWAFEYNIGSRALAVRLKRGWNIEKALATPCPRNFATELAIRRKYNKANWEINGQLYATRSKYRRGHKLSLPLQDLLAVEGVEITGKNQAKKSSISKRKVTIQNLAPEIIDKILTYYEAGVSIERIGSFLHMPKTTIDFYVKKHAIDKKSKVPSVLDKISIKIMQLLVSDGPLPHTANTNDEPVF